MLHTLLSALQAALRWNRFHYPVFRQIRQRLREIRDLPSTTQLTWMRVWAQVCPTEALAPLCEATCLLPIDSCLQGHCLWPSCLSQRSLTVLLVFSFLKLSHFCLPLYLALGPITLIRSCVFQLWRHAVLHSDGLCGADGPRNSVLGYVFGGIH